MLFITQNLLYTIHDFQRRSSEIKRIKIHRNFRVNLAECHPLTVMYLQSAIILRLILFDFVDDVTCRKMSDAMFKQIFLLEATTFQEVPRLRTWLVNEKSFFSFFESLPILEIISKNHVLKFSKALISFQLLSTVTLSNFLKHTSQSLRKWRVHLMLFLLSYLDQISPTPHPNLRYTERFVPILYTYSCTVHLMAPPQ